VGKGKDGKWERRDKGIEGEQLIIRIIRRKLINNIALERKNEIVQFFAKAIKKFVHFHQQFLRKEKKQSSKRLSFAHLFYILNNYFMADIQCNVSFCIIWCIVVRRIEMSVFLLQFVYEERKCEYREKCRV